MKGKIDFMKKGFIPISIEDYVELHLKSNPKDNRKEITNCLEATLKNYKDGVKCDCGNPIWVIGSAIAGNFCFTCLTGEAYPDDDYEIDEACE